MTSQPTEIQLYDPLSDTPTNGLYDKYKVLRDEYPVYYNAVRNVWCLSRYDDIFRADRDWRVFSNAHGVDLDVPARFFGAGEFLDTDPPLHDYLRNVVQGWFTPIAIRTLEERVDQRVSAILDNLGDEVDLAHDFAWQIPIWMICSILGIPDTDLELVNGWLTGLNERTPGADAPSPEVFAALDSLHEYLRTLASERSRNPDNDLMTALSQAVDRRELAMEELLGIAMLLFTAGSETTASLVASALLLLDSHRAQQAAVRMGDLDLPTVIEEVLRFESPVQFLCRTTASEVTVHDTVLPQGARVALLYGSANRDERRFEAADQFDALGQRRQHLAFGHGIHACLGAPLARLEGAIALRRFFERTASYEVTGPAVRMSNPNIRRIASLPATINRA